MGILYALYSACPNNRCLLEECAKELGVERLRVGRVLDVRWVAYSFWAVGAVWNNYPALYAHFQSASLNTELNGKDRAHYAGLAKKLSSVFVLLNLGLMCDALEELKDLSGSLQAESINLHRANRLIVRQVEVIVCKEISGRGTLQSSLPGC